MSLEERQFIVTRQFGPYICRSKISDELYGILLNTAKKIRKNKKTRKSNDYRTRLAGNLSEEYSYANAFSKKEEQIVEKELSWLASMYTKFSKQVVNMSLYVEPKDISMLKPIWVNFMKQGEWNPSHCHTGDISCVIYLQVPPEIKEENYKSKSSMRSNTPSAGKIEFMYGDSIGYCNTGVMMNPVVKDIFLFPAKLKHQVYPFKSKTERISVSINFADKKAALQNLHADGERKSI